MKMQKGINIEKEFLELVIQYCNWMESDKSEPDTDICIAQRLLVQLYDKAMQLEEPQSESAQDLPLPCINVDAISIEKRFYKFPLRCFYTEYFDPFSSDKENNISEFSVPADLGDIYIDLKGFLLQYNMENFRDDALWDIRFSFYTHWGKHIVSALKAIHWFMSNNIDGASGTESV